MVGAGRKNTDNTFSGVLMGDVDTASTRTMGLYGYDHGEQSFGFKIDGTAFIGKSGGGRISFDGDCGFIYSGNWLSSFAENESPFETENGHPTGLNQGKDGLAIDL
jgi:hypothetical protein